MTDVVRRRGLTKRRPAWSGELGDFQRVVSLVEKLANQRIAQLSEELSKIELWEKQKQVRPVQIEITEKTDSVTGAPPAIYSQLDRRTARQIRIFAEFANDDEALEVLFQKDLKRGELTGCITISVRSTNTGWAEQSLAELTREIDKSVPRWASLRLARGFIASLAIIFIVVWGIIALIQVKHIHRNLGNDILFSFFLVFFGTLAIGGAGIVFTWPWMFPAFELYGEGGTSSGGRRLAALGAFVLSIVGGFIVYLVT
jgi:hypothetical protein